MKKKQELSERYNTSTAKQGNSEIRSHNTSYCLIEVVTIAGLTNLIAVVTIAGLTNLIEVVTKVVLTVSLNFMSDIIYDHNNLPVF